MDIVIFGSCVSRDAFNLEVPSALKLRGYFARSSIGSAFGSSPLADTYSHALSSSFQKRMVHADFAKEFRRKWASLKFDLLVLDFIDERFPLYVHKSGAIVTLSSELRQASFLAREDGTIVAPHTRPHFELWERGWSQFVAEARDHALIDRIRIHRTYWSSRKEDGSALSSEAPDTIEAANAHLDMIYRRIAVDIPSKQYLSVEPELLIANSDHRWGPGPFHYVDDYYRRFVELLASENLTGLTARRLTAGAPISEQSL